MLQKLYKYLKPEYRYQLKLEYPEVEFIEPQYTSIQLRDIINRTPTTIFDLVNVKDNYKYYEELIDICIHNQYNVQELDYKLLKKYKNKIELKYARHRNYQQLQLFKDILRQKKEGDYELL